MFLLGYPGRTARHKTASFLAYEQNVRLPYIVKLYAWQIATMEAAGQSDRAIALKHASHMRTLANVEKRFRGQLKGLQRAAIVEQRMAQELELQAFIDSNPLRKQTYGRVIEEIGEVYQSMTEHAEFELNFENLKSASRTLSVAFTLYDAACERKKEDLDREEPYMDRNYDQTAKTLRLAVNDLHLSTDKVLLHGMLQRLSQIADPNKVTPLREIGETSDSDAVCAALFDATKLHDWSFVEPCISMSPDELVQTGDPALKLIANLYPWYIDLRKSGKESEGQLEKAYGSLIEVKQQFLQTHFVPDANSTLRFTHGRIRGYSPEDGILKTPLTTLKGLIDKSTGEEPFSTPSRVRELFDAKDFGPFVHPVLQQVPVAMLYDTDTTGGNSGSPVFNARGELVGVNFDRTFEATINDFAWNADYSRSIGVDIRYCLWITGKVYGAEHLLAEMGVRSY